MDARSINKPVHVQACWRGSAGVSVDGGEYVSILVGIGGFKDG